MKKIKLLTLAAVIVAVSSAFASSAVSLECDGQTIYGKINLSGDDITHANFQLFDQNDICVEEDEALCKYYYDGEKYVPCPDGPADHRFQAIPN